MRVALQVAGAEFRREVGHDYVNPHPRMFRKLRVQMIANTGGVLEGVNRVAQGLGGRPYRIAGHLGLSGRGWWQ